MSRSKIFLSGWLPVLIWITVIFGASTDLMSSRRTSRFIGPILRWIYPAVSDTAIRQVQLVGRKGGHVSEYAILAILCYRGVRLTRRITPNQWCGACAGWAFALAVAYAASDEWHQSFVPSREASVHDVIIDATGAALGLVLLHRWHWWRQARGLQRGA